MSNIAEERSIQTKIGTGTEPDILIVGGFGGSGSSALLDLLKELDIFFIPRCEFRLFVDPDGVMSLESALVDNWSIYQSDLAIKRFKTLVYKLGRRNNKGPYGHVDLKKDFVRSFTKHANAYIDALVDFSFRGLWVGICSPERRARAAEFRMKWNEDLKRGIDYVRALDTMDEVPDRAERVSKDIVVTRPLTEEAFLKLTREFVVNITKKSLGRHEKKCFVFDEGFASMTPAKILRYLPETGKMIAVSRDPRDQFVNMKLRRWLFQPEHLEEYIRFQNAIFERWIEQKSKVSADKLLQIKFEDLILRYDETVETVFQFLGIPPSMHTKKKTILIPEISQKKIGFWKKNVNTQEAKRLNEGLRPILDYSGYE